MSINQDQLDCGADALRRFEQSGKKLNDWAMLPKKTKDKWREKVLLVLNAINREADRQAHAECFHRRLYVK